MNGMVPGMSFLGVYLFGFEEIIFGFLMTIFIPVKLKSVFLPF